MQAEYSTLTGETPAGAEFDFDGYYVDAYFSLTGESRGLSRQHKARSARSCRATRLPTVGGATGWCRRATNSIDLSELGGASRGEQSGYAVGLDWIPLDHVRFKLNYAMTDMERVGAGVDDEASVVSLRSQFDF